MSGDHVPHELACTLTISARFKDVQDATLPVPFGHCGAKANHALFKRDDVLDVRHDDDIAPTASDEPAHQITGHPSRRQVVQPDIGVARDPRQIGDQGDEGFARPTFSSTSSISGCRGATTIKASATSAA